MREHVAIVNTHHVISDGWSIGVLVRDMAALYDAYTHGEASPLPALTIQYADYAAWQRRWLDDATPEEAARLLDRATRRDAQPGDPHRPPAAGDPRRGRAASRSSSSPPR